MPFYIHAKIRLFLTKVFTSGQNLSESEQHGGQKRAVSV